MKLGLPKRSELLICASLLLLWLLVTVIFVGFRPEHPALALLIFGLFFTSAPSRRLVLALLPFIVFGISYDWMNIVPNYTVNPVDIAGIYETEKNLFGISDANGIILSPNEFFAQHTSTFMDLMAGIFYLCWVPLPIIFGLWLYFTGHYSEHIHFALVFLLVNFIGFAGYYIHPAAPPWYVNMYGFDFIPGTHGEVAGLGAFDSLTGLNIFDALYSRNANVFAAVPSLHSAYTLVALIYCLRYRCGAWWSSILAIVTAGIWFTAVYSGHHYIIDVLLGITTAVLGYIVFEYGLMKIPAFSRFIDRYSNYITKPANNGK